MKRRRLQYNFPLSSNISIQKVSYGGEGTEQRSHIMLTLVRPLHMHDMYIPFRRSLSRCQASKLPCLPLLGYLDIQGLPIMSMLYSISRSMRSSLSGNLINPGKLAPTLPKSSYRIAPCLRGNSCWCVASFVWLIGMLMCVLCRTE